MASGGGSKKRRTQEDPPNGLTIVNHYHIVNSPMTFGISSGNTVNYGPGMNTKTLFKTRTFMIFLK
jgi:hypothetical protein